MNSAQVKDNLTLIKDPTALEASMKATDLNKEQIITMANHAMVSSARSVDAALEFDTETYFWLSLGLLILILAISSVSFFASTLFDTDAILASGEFGWGLVALGTIAFVLYAASNVIFTKKDLPL